MEFSKNSELTTVKTDSAVFDFYKNNIEIFSTKFGDFTLLATVAPLNESTTFSYWNFIQSLTRQIFKSSNYQKPNELGFRITDDSVLELFGDGISYTIQYHPQIAWVKGGIGGDQHWASSNGVGLSHFSNSDVVFSNDRVTVNPRPGNSGFIHALPSRKTPRNRPFVGFCNSIEGLNSYSDPLTLARLQARYFGVIEIHETLYTNGPTPVLVDGVLKYIYSDPNAIKHLVYMASQYNMKCISYLQGGLFQSQSIEVTLEWMREHQKEFGFHGWYFDNGAVTSHTGDLIRFFRQVREDVGPTGVIYHHRSVDPLTGYPNAYGVGTILDHYSDYVLTGETGVKIDSILGSTYLEYVTKSWAGSSWCHKKANASLVTQKEFDMWLAQNRSSGGMPRMGTPTTSAMDYWDTFGLQ